MADTVILKNGNRIKGIVVEESDTHIVLQFDREATVTFSRLEVAELQLDSEEERKLLQTEWAGRTETLLNTLAAEGPEAIPDILTEAIAPKEAVASITVGVPSSATKELERLLSQGVWNSRKTRHFVIYYQDSSHGKAVAGRAEYSLEKIVDDLRIRRKHDWNQTYTVAVVADESQWRRFLEELGIQTELTGGFAAKGGRRQIFLYPNSIPYLEVAFPHELTHLVLDEVAGGKKIPLWFDEGCANYEGGIIGLDEDLLVASVYAGKHIPLQELVTLQGYPKDAERIRLFYTESEKLVEYLIGQFGRRRFGEFTESLLKTGDFEKAFLSVYGGKIGTVKELEQRWLQYIIE